MRVVTPNRMAFLDTLAHAEGTSTSRLTRDRGYDVVVSGVDGPEIFRSYAEHPFAKGRQAKLVNDKGLKSTASGRYQFLVRDWPYYKASLKLPDFGPASQDQWALQLIAEQRAMSDVDEGRFDEAMRKCRNIWASLPGAGYGQREHAMADLRAVFVQKGGVLA